MRSTILTLFFFVCCSPLHAAIPVPDRVITDPVSVTAILWGGMVGTLADLDVLANLLLDEVTKLTWYRGYSHSILINLVAAPLLALLMHRLYRDRTQYKQWLVFLLIALQAAIWIDAFTVYGTQLLQPFGDYPVGFNSISIVDPIFAVPLLVAVITALFLRRENGRRRLLRMASR